MTFKRNEKHDQEAAKANLTLLGAGKNRQYRLYRFNECGHEQEIQVAYVRTKIFECKSCVTEKIKQEASEAGLTIIGKGKNCNYRLYKFNECNHEREIQVGDVRNGNFNCHHCQQDKLNQEAAKANLTLIGAGKNAYYRLYRFNSCNHEREITVGEVRSGVFKCHHCQQDKINKEASCVGLTIIGKGKNKDYRLYRFDSCGHEQEIQVGDVRINNFNCQTCGDSQWTKESGLYSLLITDGDKKWIKVGVAKDVDARIKLYKLNKTATVDIKYFIKIKDRLTAQKVEKFVQTKKLTDYKLDSNEMKNYMKSGFSECFDVGAWSLVETMFDKIKKHFIQM